MKAALNNYTKSIALEPAEGKLYNAVYIRPMATSRTKLGDQGEQVAMRYLLTHGYELIAHKWRCKNGEIDLITRQQTALVFVEVRTRAGRASPAESIDLRKQHKLIELAYTYTAQNSISPETAWRIDVIAINMDQHGNVLRLSHIRNAIEEKQ